MLASLLCPAIIAFRVLGEKSSHNLHASIAVISLVMLIEQGISSYIFLYRRLPGYNVEQFRSHRLMYVRDELFRLMLTWTGLAYRL